jgi:prephenate dehydrogenase
MTARTGPHTGSQPAAEADAANAGTAPATQTPEVSAGVSAARTAARSASSGTSQLEAGQLRSVLIVGSGLIGTSIGLALRELGIDVALEDTAAGRLALAVELGAGRHRSAGETFDVAVAAVPPQATAAELRRLQSLAVATTYTDVASAKAQPQAEAEAAGIDMSTYVGGHPVAGRERSGPAAAHSDLFVGRPWVITATPEADPRAVAHVHALASACGAVPVRMSADEHDAALATVSHLPHLVASLLAAQLVGAADATVGLGGTGLHDTTRVAAGDPKLWTQILVANARHLAAALAAFAADVHRTAGDLERIAEGDRGAIAALTQTLQAGALGRAKVPLKRGEPAAGFATVPIVVRDAPGELAALLRTLGDAAINVEDVRVEHEPGRPVGVVELDVREDAVPALIACMRESGWQVYS